MIGTTIGPLASVSSAEAFSMQEYTSGVQPVPGYHLVKFLGRGGFGQVWKATAPGGIPIAMKLIDLHEQQALKELRALNFMRKIKHPHLVPIQGLWIKDEHGEFLEVEQMDLAATTSHGPRRPSEVIIAMGLGDKNLLDRLRECQKENLPGIPASELLGYMEEAAKAIDFLNKPSHELGSGPVSVLHCDIKPQNILIVGDTAQVCDFGLARVVTEASVSNPIYTAAYVAPEMLRDNRPSPTTDQYSLAISYVEMRTGALPLNATGPAMLYAHLEGKLDLTRVTPAEETVLRRATDKDPSKRFPSCVEMVKALRRAVEGVSSYPGISARSTGPLLLKAGEEIVPGYKLIRLLGKGGYGAVWEATAPGQMRVALKIVRNLDAPSGKQEFRALELMKSVHHKNLLEIHAYWLMDMMGQLIPDEARDLPNAPRADTLVLATQLAQGNLSDRLKEYQAAGQGAIPPKELLNYMWQVAEALDYLNQPLHRLGDKTISIVHRDIKPENILLMEDVVKVADFGLAKILEGTSAEIHAESVGMTLAYAAPELMENRVTPWTDQYALALTYYRLRTGFMPFGVIQSQEELIAIHLTGRLDLSRLPAAEREVIATACALKPEARFPCCLDMVRYLTKACQFTEADIVLPAMSLKTAQPTPGAKTRQTYPPFPGDGVSGGEVSAVCTNVTPVSQPADPFGTSIPPLIQPPPLPPGTQPGYPGPYTTDLPISSSPPPIPVKPPPRPSTLPKKEGSHLVPAIISALVMGVVITGVVLLLMSKKDPEQIADGTSSPTKFDPTEFVQTQRNIAKAARQSKRWEEARKALDTTNKYIHQVNELLQAQVQLEQALLAVQKEPADGMTARPLLRELQPKSYQLSETERTEFAKAYLQFANQERVADVALLALKALRDVLKLNIPVAERAVLVEGYAELASTYLDAKLTDGGPPVWDEIAQVCAQAPQAGAWTLALQTEALLEKYRSGSLPPSVQQLLQQIRDKGPQMPLSIAPYLQALAQAAQQQLPSAGETLLATKEQAPWTLSQHRRQRAVELLRKVAENLYLPATARKPFASPQNAELTQKVLQRAQKWSGQPLPAKECTMLALAAWHQQPPHKELARETAASLVESNQVNISQQDGLEVVLIHIAVQEDTPPGRRAAWKGYTLIASAIPDRFQTEVPPPEIYSRLITPAFEVADQVRKDQPSLEHERQVAVVHAALGRLLMARSNLAAAWPFDPISRGKDAFYQANQRDPRNKEYKAGYLYFQALGEIREARRVLNEEDKREKHQRHYSQAKAVIDELEAMHKIREATFLRAKLLLCEQEIDPQKPLGPKRAFEALSAKLEGTARVDAKCLPLLLARVELCANHWKNNLESNTKPEDELAIAELALKQAQDPISKAIAAVDQGLLHLSLMDSGIKINTPVTLSELLTRIEEASRLAPNHPTAWIWKFYKARWLRGQAYQGQQSNSEKLDYLNKALALAGEVRADQGVEAPDKKDVERIEQLLASLKMEIRQLQP
jgi:serine/threonine protein kinase